MLTAVNAALQRVPPREFLQLIGGAGRARDDRLVVEVTPDVRGQIGRRDDPYFEERLRSSIYGTTADMGRMMEGFAAAAPLATRRPDPTAGPVPVEA